MLRLFCIAVIGSLMACATPVEKPNMHYVLAREALQAAREVEASKYSPGNYYKAEEAFRHGMKSFSEKSYSSAIEQFKESMSFSEKAETMARFKRQQAGDEAL